MVQRVRKQGIKMQIKAIIFDVFGTLIQVIKGNSAQITMNRITAECGAIIDEDEFLREWRGYYASHTADGCNFMTEREIFTSRIRMFYERYGISRSAEEDTAEMLSGAFERDIYEDVLPALGVLKAKVQILLGSNTDNDVLQAVMFRNSLSADKVYTSEDLHCYKPDRKFFQHILNDNALQPDEVLFVGDNPRDDILGPKLLGIRTALIDRNGDSGQHGQNYTIRSLNELIDIITETR